MATSTFQDILKAAELTLNGKQTSMAAERTKRISLENNAFIQLMFTDCGGLKLPRFPRGAVGFYTPLKRSPRIRPELSENLSERQRRNFTVTFELSEEFDLPYLPMDPTEAQLKTFFRQAAVRTHPDHHNQDDPIVTETYAEKFRRLKSSIDDLIETSQFENQRQAA